MISIIVLVCIGILLLGATAGCLVFGVTSIGVLLAIGFEVGLFLVPIILVLLVIKWVWSMVTSSKKKEKE